MVAAQNRRSMFTATFRAATIGSGTLLVAGAAHAVEPAQLVKTICSSCHSLELVTKKQATKDEWRDTVKAMVDRGAALKPDEVAAVTDYLAANFGKHDRAKELVESVCTLCHEFGRIARQELSKDEWAGMIKGMLAEGAPLTDEEFSMVVDYLAKTYGVKERQ
jgi:cytochrome c5